MDELLSMTTQKVKEIYEKMTLIETTTMMIETIDKGRLVIQMEAGDFASLELLSEEQMDLIKGYIRAELFANMQEAKEFLMQLNGIPATVETTPCDELTELSNHDLINLDEEDEKMAGRKALSGKMTDEDMKKCLDKGMTAEQIAQAFGLKDSSAKKYVRNFKAYGSISQAKGIKSEKQEKSKLDGVDPEEVKKAVKSGKTVKELATHYQVNKKEMYDFLKANHIG